MSTYRLHRGYAYGYDGKRAIKMTGNATIDPNGTLINTSDLNNITIYPNEYLTVTQAEYTKYYYAGGNRIASKIGTGGFEKMQRLCTQDLNLSSNANALFGNVLQQVANTANQPIDEYPVNTCGSYNVATELLTNQLPDFYISQTNLNFTQNNLLQQFRQNLAGGTEPVYFFHSDHLGSASWITNNTGLPVQHLQYLPFGEHFANEHSSGYDERFTFTGKERDAETGYYYHGARFNSSDIGWLSVDPMSDKYPSMSPYAYCAWNPVKYIDPNGEFKISVHKEIVKKIVEKKGFSEKQVKQIIYGTGGRADIFRPFKDIHLDNYNSKRGVENPYKELSNSFTDAIKSYKNNIEANNFKDAGENLHTIADFYAHSNYVELYQQYVGKDTELKEDEIPLFSEVLSKSEEYSGFIDLLKTNLKTGCYSLWIIDFFSKSSDSHKHMNHDSKRSIMGKNEFHNISGFSFAKSLAEREIEKTVGLE